MQLANHIGSRLVQDKLVTMAPPRTVRTSGPERERLTCGHLGGPPLQQQLPALLAHVAVALQEPGEGRVPDALGREGRRGQGEAGHPQGCRRMGGCPHLWGRGVSIPQTPNARGALPTRHAQVWRSRCDSPCAPPGLPALTGRGMGQTSEEVPCG